MKSYFLNNEIMDCIISSESDPNRHSHEYMELVCVLRGSIRIVTAAGSEELAEEEIQIINANQVHQIKAGPGVHYLSIYVNLRMLRQLTERSIALFAPRITDPAASGSIRELLQQIVNLYLKKDGPDKITVTGFYYLLAGELIRSCLMDESCIRNNTMKKEDRFMEILGYMQLHYQDLSGIGELAEKMYLSSGYLSKLIKKRTGVSFTEYLNQIRMQHALEDLVNTEKSMARIVYDHGFPNPSSFHLQFRKLYQMTPGEYRKQFRGQLPMQREQAGVNEQEDTVLQEYLLQKASSDSPDRQSHIRVTANASVAEKLDQTAWNVMINGGDLALLLNAEVQNQILHLQEELQIRYLRFWNIFQSSMLRGEGKKTYNFSDLDKVIDFLLTHHIKPYIELATKPRRIYRTVQSTVLNDPEYELFQDLGVYKCFLKDFMVHYLNKYGESELKTWYFELWRNWEQDSLDSYLDIYQRTYTCIKSFSSELQLGGAGFSPRYSSEDIGYLLKGWKKADCEPDFYSVYGYPYEPFLQNGKATPKSSSDPEFLIRHIRKIKNLLSECQMKRPHIHVTEWNSTISNRNILNDSSFKGAFIVKSCLDSLEMVEVMGYWIATDLFSEYGDTQDRLFGGCGLMAGNGLPKAAYYGFKFLNALHHHLLVRSGNCVITAEGTDRFCVLSYNYKHYGGQYYLSEEDQVDSERIFSVFHDYENLSLDYQIQNVKNGRYQIESFYLNSHCGSILEEWSRFNGLKALGTHGLEYLRCLCIPRMEVTELEVENSEITINQNLSANEIRLNLITYLY